MFAFELEQRLQCMACNRVKYNRQKEQFLFVPIPVDSKAEKGTPVDLDACLQAYFADGAIDGLNCPCGEKAAHAERKRFVTYPKTLVVCLKRIVFDEWVPKKLEVELQMDVDGIHDFEKLRGNNCELQPGEEGFPEAVEPDEVEPEFD